jgi:hypothetical protein
LLAGVVDGGAGVLAGLVDGAGVAEVLEEVWTHGVENFWQKRSGGVGVHVDAPHSLSLRLWMLRSARLVGLGIDLIGDTAMKKCWAMAAMAVMTMGAGAQMGQMSAGPAVGTIVSPAKAITPLISVWEEEFVGVAKAMPADKYDFKPTTNVPAGAKFDGVRTFADEIKHVTQANYYFYSAASGMKPDVDMKAIGTLKTKAEIVAALEASFVFAHKAVDSLTLENSFKAIKSVDGMTTPIALMAFGPAHGYDHYGQMVEYLRMNGVLPPGSK